MPENQSEGASTDFAKRMEAASEYWASKRSRMTMIRKVICEIIFKTTQPFEAEWLLKKARRVDQLISMATIYRTLKGLRDAELVEEFHGAAGPGYYRLRAISQSSSSVIVCKDCGRTIAVEDPCLRIREGAQAQERGFKLTHVRVQAEATCEELEQTGVCQKECLPMVRRDPSK